MYLFVQFWRNFALHLILYVLRLRFNQSLSILLFRSQNLFRRMFFPTSNLWFLVNVRKKLFFLGIKQSTSVLVQTQKNWVFFAWFWIKVLHFLAFQHKKHWKLLFWPAFGVRSTQTLVEIFNKWGCNLVYGHFHWFPMNIYWPMSFFVFATWGTTVVTCEVLHKVTSILIWKKLRVIHLTESRWRNEYDQNWWTWPKNCQLRTLTF